MTTQPPLSSLEEAHASLSLESLSQGHDISWRATGDSMWPSIPSGSRVVIGALPAAEVRRGEVGLFMIQPEEVSHPSEESDVNVSQALWSLHRVIKHDRDAKLIYTRGDHLPFADVPHRYHEWRGVLKRVHLESQHPEGVAYALRGEGRSLIYKLIGLCGQASARAHQRDARGRLARHLGLTFLYAYALYSRYRAR